MSLLKFTLRNHGRVRSNVPCTFPQKQTAVELIMEDAMESLIADYFSILIQRAFLFHVLMQLRERTAFVEQYTPKLLDDRERIMFYVNFLLSFLAKWIIDVSDRSQIRTPTLIDFTLLAALGVFTEITAVLRRHSEFNIENQCVFRWIVNLIWRDDFLNRSLLEHPYNRTAINHISSEAIKFPTKNAMSLTFLNALDHIREPFSPRLLCCLLIGNNICNFYIPLRCNLFERTNLIGNRLNLLLLILR